MSGCATLPELTPSALSGHYPPLQLAARSHDHERPPPSGPDSGEHDPEKPISSAQWGAGHGSLVDVELLAQGQVLKGELAVAANEEGEEPKQAEHERDHRALIVLGS